MLIKQLLGLPNTLVFTSVLAYLRHLLLFLPAAGWFSAKLTTLVSQSV